MKSNMKDLDTFAIDMERKKSKRERFVNFEHKLRYLLCEMGSHSDLEDILLLSDIRQSILVFVMKDEYEETNEIFLNNMKENFYRSIKRLEEKHPDLTSRTMYIKLFMEDFYF